MAEKVWLYGVLMFAGGRFGLAGLTVISGHESIVRTFRADPTHPVALVATTVKLKLPPAVGVPDKRPADEKDNPDGRFEPVASVKVYGSVLPDAENCRLYGELIFPGAIPVAVGLIETVGQF